MLRVLFASFVAGAAFLGAVSASSVPIEYQLFRSLCSVVEITTSMELDSLIDRRMTDENVSAVIGEKLLRHGLTFPVEYGRQCFPGKVGIASKQLSLQFNVVLASNPELTSQAVLSLMLYAHYPGVQKSPQEFPAKIAFCRRQELSACVIQKVNEYADETALWTIFRAQELLKGSK